MAEELAKPRRHLTVIIQGLAEKAGAKGPYAVITTPARPGMQYPDTWNAFDLNLVKGVRVGDTVTLLLEQGNPKKDGKGYYENVVGVEHSGAITSAAPTPAANAKAGNGKVEATPPVALPWHRFIAWGEIVEQALKMVAATLSLGEDEVTPENQQAEYAKRFEWAMETICAAIRGEMAK